MALAEVQLKPPGAVWAIATWLSKFMTAMRRQNVNFDETFFYIFVFCVFIGSRSRTGFSRLFLCEFLASVLGYLGLFCSKDFASLWK